MHSKLKSTCEIHMSKTGLIFYNEAKNILAFLHLDFGFLGSTRLPADVLQQHVALPNPVSLLYEYPSSRQHFCVGLDMEVRILTQFAFILISDPISI